MGKLVNAGKLLNAIEGAGRDMRLPNVYVAQGQNAVIELSRFFVDGEKKIYASVVENESVATAIVDGTRLTVTGVAEGFTLLTITVDGADHVVNVTVRKNANNNGWM